MKHHPMFLRFVHLTQAITDELIASSLDLTALRLLETVAVAYANDKPLTVTEAMNLSLIASPATLHRKLDQLREAGFIDLEFQASNRRTKYVIPTPSTGKYFEQMGKALVNASQQA